MIPLYHDPVIDRMTDLVIDLWSLIDLTDLDCSMNSLYHDPVIDRMTDLVIDLWILIDLTDLDCSMNSLYHDHFSAVSAFSLVLHPSSTVPAVLTVQGQYSKVLYHAGGISGITVWKRLY
jgi:hypothetical protein